MKRFVLGLLLGVGVKATMKDDIQRFVKQNLTFDETGLYEAYVSKNGMTQAGYIKYSGVKILIERLENEFSDIVSRVSIPNESGDNFLYADPYQFVVKMGKGDGSSILIDSAHHARELTSVQLVCYVMLRFVYEYHADPKMQTFFQKHSAYFIPIVNADGFHEISQEWEETGHLVMVRKNLHPNKVKKCKEPGNMYEYGVDLNRNYDFAFAYHP